MIQQVQLHELVGKINNQDSNQTNTQHKVYLEDHA